MVGRPAIFFGATRYTTPESNVASVKYRNPEPNCLGITSRTVRGFPQPELVLDIHLDRRLLMPCDGIPVDLKFFDEVAQMCKRRPSVRLRSKGGGDLFISNFASMDFGSADWTLDHADLQGDVTGDVYARLRRVEPAESPAVIADFFGKPKNAVVKVDFWSESWESWHSGWPSYDEYVAVVTSSKPLLRAFNGQHRSRLRLRCQWRSDMVPICHL